MELDDRVTVSTPEGVDVELVVAGLGSRFMSSLVDTTVVGLLILPLLLLASEAGRSAIAVAALGGLLAMFGYPMVCDAFLGGRTLGRRVAGLRLVTEEGTTVDLVPAALRNVVRIIDFLPVFYSVGTIACLASSRNQRLGDMAAGTLVVRAEPVRAAAPAVPGARRSAVGTHDEVAVGGDAPSLRRDVAGWDLTGVRGEDLTVVRSFLARRHGLDPVARSRVAGELAGRLAPVVVGPDRSEGDEAFLEALVAGRDDGSR